MKKRAILNFAASAAYQILNLMLGLIVPKIYTEVFGSVYNGLNQSVSQVISLLSVLQFGISAVSFQQMFKYISDGDKKGIANVYWATGKAYRRMGYWFVSIITPLIFIFPFLIKDDVAKTTIILFLTFRSVSAVMEYFFQAKYSVILIANNFSSSIYLVNILILTVSNGLHLLILFTVKNILLYQSVIIFTTLLRLAIVYTYVNKKFPYLRKYKQVTELTALKEKRKDVLVSEISGMAIDSTDLLVLSTLSGLVSASIYSVYNFVVMGLSSIMGSLQEAVFAGVGKTYYDDIDEFRRKMGKFESVYLFLLTVLNSTAIIMFKPFILVYTSKMDARYYYAGFPVMFLIAKILVNLRIPSIVAINVAGHFKQVKYYAVAEAVINLTLSLLLVKPLGIYGVLIGTIAGSAYRTPLIIRYAAKNVIKQSAFVYVRKILVWCSVFSLSFLFSLFVEIKAANLIVWLVYTALTAAAVVLFCLIWAFLFDKAVIKEFGKIKDKITKRNLPRHAKEN